MCGINFIQSSFEIKKIDFIKELNKCNLFLKKNKIKEILKIIRLLKRNQIFIELIKNNNQKLKKKLLSLEKKLLKKKKLVNFDLIEDIIWVIRKEIIDDSKKLHNTLIKNKIETTEKSIIFFKYYLNSLESLNYLETRGRDSLGLGINILSSKKINFSYSNNINNQKINFFQKKISKIYS